MAKRQLPTPDELRQLLRYEPETGKLFWLPRPETMFRTKRGHSIFMAQCSGREAFTTTNSNGYQVAALNGVMLYAHRVIWAICTGSWPQHDIDHANCLRNDNRLSNLRPATRAQNIWNSSRRSTNKSGSKGVYWDGKGRKWVAQIRVHGRVKALGRFDDIEAAAAAYKDAADVSFGGFARSS